MKPRVEASIKYNTHIERQLETRNNMASNRDSNSLKFLILKY